MRNTGLIVGGVAAFAIAAWALHLNRLRTRNDGKRLDNEAERLRQQAQSLENHRRRLVNDTYVKAIEQLGHDKMEVRLGAIYGLERIARDADDFDLDWSIMETLTAYIRERPASNWGDDSEVSGASGAAEPAKTSAGQPGEEQTPQPAERKRPPTDIAAVFTVLKRRSRTRIDQETAAKRRLDLRHVDLAGAILGDIALERADLIEARLEGANLRWARLKGADLSGARLEGADLSLARLEGANLVGARLEGANLRWSRLEGAKLWGADFTNADFTDATGLTAEQFEPCEVYPGGPKEAAITTGAIGLTFR